MSRKKNSKSKHYSHQDRKLIYSAYVILVLIGIGWIAGNRTTTPGSATSTTSPSSTPVISMIPSTPAGYVLVVTPTTIIQGDPVMITIPGLTTRTKIESGAVDNSPLLFTMYQGVPTAIYGININHSLGSTTVTVMVNDGKNDRRFVATFFVRPRARLLEPFPVPEQVGGNSSTNQVALADELAAENIQLAAVPLYTKGALWSEPFIYPLKASDQDVKTLTITDPYGLDRDSGNVTILHMGTDFKVPLDTPVYAVNDGIVRLARYFTEYGYTVIIDHGLGIESIYVHLSSIIVTPNEMVNRGEIIGYSGETGYATGPHLHLSIKINRVSVDPMRFFALFGLPPLPVIDANGTD